MKKVSQITHLLYLLQNKVGKFYHLLWQYYISLPITYTLIGKCSIIYINVYTMLEYINKGLVKKLLHMMLDNLHTKDYNKY